MNRWMRAALVSLALVLVAAAAVTWAQATTKKGYLVARVHVTDAQQYGEYVKVAGGITAKYGGRYLARGGRTATLEGPGVTDRLVIVEFPSFEQAQAFYASPEYAAARKIRAGAAEASFVLIEGYEP